MRKLLHSKLRIAVLCLALSGLAHAAENLADLKQAQSLISSGKAAEAYALLLPFEFYQAGDPAYDYLLGVAALDSGKYNAATLAFERVLAVNPNHAGARMDLARAYFALNDLERSEEQFKLVLTQNPPAVAKKTAENHLERIEELKKAKNPALTAYVEGVAGYDSNLTNVTRDFTNAVFQSYSLAGVQPTGNSIARDDFYAGLNANLQYTLPVDSEVTWNFGLDGKQREYFSERKFRSTTLGGNLGIGYKVEQDTFRFGAYLQRFIQEGVAATSPATSLDSDVYGIGGSWQRLIDPRTLAGLFAQFNFIRYGDLPINDANTVTIGASVTHSLALPYQPVFLASLYRTQENALNSLSNGADFSREVVGFRLAGQMTFDPKWEAYAQFGYQFRDDKQLGARQPNNFGRDTLADLTLGLNWKFDKDWSLRPKITHTDNRSNISLYNSNRTDVSIALRRELR